VETFFIDPLVFTHYAPLKRLKTFVDQNLDRPIYLADLAREACLEERYLSDYFSRKTGCALHA
jgi:AraC-like DNA-binding protein